MTCLCLDVNECTETGSTVCEVMALCENLIGSYKCSCNKGYTVETNGRCTGKFRQ